MVFFQFSFQNEEAKIAKNSNARHRYKESLNRTFGWGLLSLAEKAPRGSFLHHLIREHLSVLHGDAERVGAGRQLAEVEGLEGVALRAHETALQVVELDLLRLHIGRVLQAELVLGGVGVEHVGANLYAVFIRAHRAVVIE